MHSKKKQLTKATGALAALTAMGVGGLAPTAGAIVPPDYSSSIRTVTSCNPMSATDLTIYKAFTKWPSATKAFATVPRGTILTITAANGYTVTLTEATTTSGSVSITAGGSIGPFAKVEGEVKAGIERTSGRTIGQTYTVSTSGTFTNSNYDSGTLVSGLTYGLITTVRTSYSPSGPGQPIKETKSYHYTVDNAVPCYAWQAAK